MTADFKTELKTEQSRYFLAAGGGISLPIAGALYWIAMAVLSHWIQGEQWALAAAAMSGLIFPVGLLLQKPLRSPFMKSKSPLSGAAMLSIAAINALWPVHFIIISIAPEAAVLSLAIGMSLHWPIIGWTYGSRVSIVHGFARVAVATVLWFALPEGRYDILPLAIAALYLGAAAGIRWELGRLRRKTGAMVGALSGQAA